MVSFLEIGVDYGVMVVQYCKTQTRTGGVTGGSVWADQNRTT
ncbi:uncharacterized protein G2W53_003665 [Senna tora]|uniref:Uncharacterized protein n=1 Tax=Senna tora TaxID=362788 RepID=A0A835CJG6_9FABA|nr:uncharacterized protein G2W53_003665 [Senna tora]